MQVSKEKRCSDRYANNGSITISFSLCRCKDIKARLVNYSDCGLCFSSEHPLVPGTTVFIRASDEIYENRNPESPCQLRSVGMATIKWCREKKHLDKTDHEIGAVYLFHY